MSRFLHDTGALYLRLGRASLRMPAYVIMSVVQPVMWVVLFGQLFGRVATLPGFAGGGSYVQYLAPGIAVVTALFGAAYTGLGLLGEMQSGFLTRLLATPVSRAAIITARLAVSATQVAVQATVILAITAIMGARLRGGLVGLLLVYLGAGLLAAATGALSCALALVAGRQEILLAVTNFVMLPMIYLSSTLMARDLMPGWIQVASRLNPLDWAVQAARAGFEAGLAPHAAGDVALLAAFTVVCGALATRAFGRYRRGL